MVIAGEGFNQADVCFAVVGAFVQIDDESIWAFGDMGELRPWFDRDLNFHIYYYIINCMKIGVFDSGMGGTTILKEIEKRLPEEEYSYIADSKNCPYGEKTDEELQKIVIRNVEQLKNWGAEIVVIACNTATVKCIEKLRKNYPKLTFVGTEPAIRLAARSKAKNILVLATPGTVKSERAQKLLSENKQPGQRIVLLPCPGLADTIEHTLEFTPDYRVTPLTNEKKRVIMEVIRGILVSHDFSWPKNFAPDAVVLGCTHYSLIKPELQSFFEKAKLIDGNAGVARRVETVKKSRQF